MVRCSVRSALCVSVVALAQAAAVRNTYLGLPGGLWHAAPGVWSRKHFPHAPETAAVPAPVRLEAQAGAGDMEVVAGGSLSIGVKGTLFVGGKAEGADLPQQGVWGLWGGWEACDACVPAAGCSCAKAHRYRSCHYGDAPPTPPLVSHGYEADLNPDVMPLDNCHGDCDTDAHCRPGYSCHQQDDLSPIPGCEGSPEEGMDYCVRDAAATTPLARFASYAKAGDFKCVAQPAGCAAEQCDFNEVTVYVGPANPQAGTSAPDNPGTMAEKTAACAKACAEKKPVADKRQTWGWSKMGPVRGFAVNSAGTCYCQDVASDKCWHPPASSTSYARYDFPAVPAPTTTAAPSVSFEFFRRRLKAAYWIACAGEAAQSRACPAPTCGAGKYASGQCCKPCEKGTYQALAGQSTCQPCPAGTFQPATGQTTCTACAAGRFQSAEGQIACSSAPCCGAGQEPLRPPHRKSASCTACPVGRFKSLATAGDGCSAACAVCPRGQFAQFEGSTVCTKAEPGRSQPDEGQGGDLCCAPGTYQDMSGQASCKICPAGTFAHDGCRTSCTSHNCCSHGETGVHSASSSSCVKCPAGSIRNGAGQCDGACTVCAAGKFANAEKTGCTDCPAGQFTADASSTSCTMCAPGTYQARSGQTSCTPVSPGHYVATMGQTFQRPHMTCTCGLFSTGGTATSPGKCEGCPHGTFKSASGVKCESCPSGTYGDANGLCACKACLKGTFQDSVAAVGCKACPKGRFGSVEGAVGELWCPQCPGGQYQDNVAQTKCVRCENGKRGNNSAGRHHESHCSSCPAGKFFAQSMSDSGAHKAAHATGDCVMCASGQYQHAPQQMSCHKCSVKKVPYTQGNTDLHKWWTRNEAGATKCEPVPFNCVPEAWGSWGACSKSCNGGRRTRTRGIQHPAWEGGTSCSNFEEDEPCNDHCCPIDCVPADWSLHLWGSCTKSCGEGVRSRSRPIAVQDQCGGKPCTQLEDDEACNQHKCPVDCEMHLWSSWATCSEGCGTGTQTRVRAVKQAPLFGGKKCPHASEQQLCNRQCCKGFFHSGADGFDCTACTAGHFAAGEGVSACDECPEGKYQTFTGHHKCSECPKGTFQPKKAKTSLEIDCQHCAPGKYQDGVAKSDCEDCAAGRANAELKRTDAADCRACSAGQYADRVGTVTCKDCDIGTFSSNAAATRCTDCAAGRHNPYMSRYSEHYCYVCPCGKWASSGSSVCSDCAPGKFRATQGGVNGSSCVAAAAGFEPSRLWASTTNDKCGQSACPVGKYQDEVGGPHCKECPAGTHNPTTQATSLSACATCPKGTWSSSGRSSCTDCDAGTYSPMPGAGAVTLCKACRPGSYAPAAASPTCTHCEPGRWQSAHQSTACQLCQAGKFSAATGASSTRTCKRCDVGFFQPMPGLTECIACATGKFADAEGLTGCTSCPKGTANGGTAGASANACVACGAGHFADARASSTCKQCALGRAVSAAGSTDEVACRHCSAGQYADATGSGTCKKCAKGKRGQNTAGASSEFVHCLRCPAGKFQEADGMTKCLNCASGKYTAFDHDKITCHACAVLDSVRRYDTKGLAGQMECWPVPVGCKVGAWGSFDTCTKSCGTGQYTRTRRPLRQPASGPCGLANQGDCDAAWGGGKTCTEVGLSNTQSCNTHPCPVDCIVSAWSHWEPCTKRCGIGESARARVVERPASLGGKACPALRQQEVCNAHSCALSALPSQCHSTHVRCTIDEIKRPTLTYLMGRPECARRAIDENNMCWNNNNCKTDYATPGWCHGADSAGEAAFLKRHPPHTTPALVVKQDRSRNTGQFHCERVRKPPPNPSLVSLSKDPPAGQLAVCHGDCDHDGHCQNGFVCHHQATPGPVPGCEGSPVMGMDYCVYFNAYRGMLVNAHKDLSRECRCVCNQHVCCSNVNKLVSGGVGVVGGRYEVDSMQECCNMCSNHPQCDAWEYSSENTCMLKRTIGPTTFVDNPATADLTTWAGAKAGAPCS